MNELNKKLSKWAGFVARRVVGDGKLSLQE